MYLVLYILYYKKAHLYFTLKKKTEILYCQGVFYFKAIKWIVKQNKIEYIKAF